MQEDPLKIKINDYCNYIQLAFKNFKEKNYSDSALNSRKAAEAACKIIILHAFNTKVAENKIYGKSLRELITQLIRDGKTKKEATEKAFAMGYDEFMKAKAKNSELAPLW